MLTLLYRASPAQLERREVLVTLDHRDRQEQLENRDPREAQEDL